jgi:hypothetical protein
MKKSVVSLTDKRDTTKLINCSCYNEYQDKRYKGKRVANRVNKAPVGTSQWRCTVCGKVQ